MAQLAKKLETVCTQGCLVKEKRPDLLLVTNHYSLDVPTERKSQYQTKAAIVQSIMSHWDDNNLLDCSKLDRFECSLDSCSIIKRNDDWTIDLREGEGEQHTHELEMWKIKLDSEKGRPKNVGMFDPAKFLRLLPLFNEGYVEQFFRCFEKVALALKWSEESWVIMVQKALKGRAQKCFNLSPEGYSELKRLVLREYELIPESYRLKFWKNRKLSDSETYVDYLRVKKLDLDKWLDSSDIKYENLKLYDLILLEKFTRQLPSRLKYIWMINILKILVKPVKH